MAAPAGEAAARGCSRRMWRHSLADSLLACRHSCRPRRASPCPTFVCPGLSLGPLGPLGPPIRSFSATAANLERVSTRFFASSDSSARAQITTPTPATASLARTQVGGCEAALPHLPCNCANARETDIFCTCVDVLLYASWLGAWPSNMRLSMSCLPRLHLLSPGAPPPQTSSCWGC
jgi:hypothetical protein